jgi:hypothetical protein
MTKTEGEVVLELASNLDEFIKCGGSQRDDDHGTKGNIYIASK